MNDSSIGVTLFFTTIAASMAIYLAWWLFGSRHAGQAAATSRRAITICLIVQCVVVALRFVIYETASDSSVASPAGSATLILDFLLVTCFAAATISGGGAMLQYAFYRCSSNKPAALERFQSEIIEFARHPWRQLRILLWLWILLIISQLSLLLLPGIVSRSQQDPSVRRSNQSQTSPLPKRSDRVPATIRTLPVFSQFQLSKHAQASGPPADANRSPDG
jgi:hypothetical protein